MSDHTRPITSFDASYSGTPPWDIGHAQPALVALEERGAIGHSVLDVGCGTGELVLHLAARGHEAWGIDASPKAIAKARAKAEARGASAVLKVADALDLGALGRTFDAAIDSGVFHVFSDADQARYAASLARAVRPGGAYFTLVFSDREPADWGGPRRIDEGAFARTFRAPEWRVREVRAAKFETTYEAHRRRGGGEGWLAWIERT